MNLKKLRKLKSQLEALRSRSANIRDRELVSIAKSLGRRRSSRGKEPTYVNEIFKDLRPLSIPSHPGALNRFTAGSIIDQLELDIIAWEEFLSNRGDEEGDVDEESA
jgi:hypothetical protein